MEFKKFKLQMQQHFQLFLAGQSVLFLTDVDKDKIWNTYLKSFPEEEQQGFNCNCCKQFLRPYGNIVSIVDNKIKSIWDFVCDEPYQSVVNALDELVIAAPIRDVFVTRFAKLGTDFNHESTDDGVITWNHMYLVLPKAFVTFTNPLSDESIMGTLRTKKETFKRALDTITIDALETVIDLINQNSLYRGQESLGMLDSFLTIKRHYTLLKTEARDNYAWQQSNVVSGAISGIRNTSIGTLLVDVSEGKELDHAVGAFERIMAPANYKRPTAILTNKMIVDAQTQLEEMGLVESLGRRYAVLEDITVNNVLFVNRDTKKAMNVFDELSKDVTIGVKTLGKTEEIGIEDFINNVLPTATNIEMIIQNAQMGNFMSLIAPTIKDSKPLFKWDNGFSWAYMNDVADSDIRQAVIARGGRVDGVFRFSHSWNYQGQRNASLMDLHVFMPSNTVKADNGIHDIYGNNQRVGWNHRNHAASGGIQDVDYTSAAPIDYIPVENITFPTLSKLPEGEYICKIHNWSFRNPTTGGGKAEIEFGGQLYQYEYKMLKQKEWLTVAVVTLKNGYFTIEHKLPLAQSVAKDVWGVKTNQYQKVNVIMASPNYWDGKTTGNKHYFFILDGCKNPDTPRGFFNEYLKDELMAQKRVFEALGSKMRVAPSDEQLSGVGFSTTNRASIICKVEGTFNRVLKINI